MLDELRDRIARYLLSNRICIITTSNSADALAMPAWYRLVTGSTHQQTLQVDCLLPKWTLLNYHIAKNPRVTLIFPDLSADRLRWLQYQGTAQAMAGTEWNDSVWLDDGYLIIRVTPMRIDLIDESRGWGVRETWEK